MVMRAALVGLLAVALGSGAGGAADSADPRAELGRLRQTLETSVRRVSRPLAASLATPPQVYRLKGYGSVLVLSPRMLPVRRAATDPEGQALAQAVRGLEESLARVRSAELREQIQASLQALRRTEARRAGEPGRVVVRREISDAEANVLGLPEQIQLAVGEDPELTRHFQLMQEQADAFRREAELMMAQAERELWVRLQAPRPPSPPGALVSAGPPPVPPAAPSAPAPPTPLVAPAPRVPEPPETPGAPPWRYWVETGEEADGPGDTRSEEALFEQVREAVVAGLEAHRGPLSMPGQEYLVAAVDFVARNSGRRRVARTLVVRARAGDLAERRAGRLSAADFRKRIAFELD
jgi:hypothetical protein